MRVLKYLVLLLLPVLCWIVFIGFGAANGFLLKPITSENTPEAFVAVAQQEIDKTFVGNFAMAIIEDGQVKQNHFYSIDDPIDENSVFQVASVSKWVTAWGVMALVEQGQLDIDKPVDDYLTRWHLPPSEYDNRQVTVRRLLSHSAGLVDDLGYDGFLPGTPVQTLEASLTKAADASYAEGVARVGIEPGTQYMYSGASYTLLQLLIEEISGQSFQDYMTKTIFEPLGMTNSTFILTEKPNLPLAQRYNADGSISLPNNFTALAAASLFTSTADLSKFVIANISPNPVLSAKTIQQMSHAEAFIGVIGVYGTGPHLYSQNDPNSNIIGHDGSSGRPTINTAARVDLLSKSGIIILEMGSHDIASNLADEWLYWKADIADRVVIQRNASYLLTWLISGLLVIIALFIRYLLRQRKQSK